MHGPRRKTLHTVGRQGWRPNTLQPALAVVVSSTVATATTAAIPARACSARMNAASLLDVGADLYPGHAVRIGGRLALLDLVDHVHTRGHLTDNGILTVEKRPVAKHDEELTVGGIVIAALPCHADDAAFERYVGEFGRQVGIFRATAAVALLAVTGLRHEAADDAVERHVVVELVARQLLDALGVLGGQIGPLLHHVTAFAGIDHDRILRVDAGRQRLRQT